MAVGGGSGGHVTPVVAVIDELAAQLPNGELEVEFVCDKAFESQARRLMKNAPVPVGVHKIVAGKFRRYAHLNFWQHFTVPGLVVQNTIDIFKNIFGLCQSLWMIGRFRPDVVFCKGGYVCLPVGIAAWLLRRPLVIHDSDTRPGLTNQILSRFATKIATGSPLENYSYDRNKSRYIGVPIAKEFQPISTEQQATLKRLLGYDPKSCLVVAVGGGLGSAVINHAIFNAARQLQNKQIEVYNITGKAHFTHMTSLSDTPSNYRAVEFLYNGMAEVLGAADIVVARGSATFLQELSGLKKAVIAIPAKQLGDQQKNVSAYRQADAVESLSDDDVGSADDTQLAVRIQHLSENDPERRRLAEALHQFSRPKAAKELAEMIIEVVKRR